jgi:methionyl aminopeptidase
VMIIHKTREELIKMDEANRIVKGTLARLAEAVRPGVTTLDLELLAEQCIREAGAEPAFKGYRGFPCCLCVSVNDEVVHGIPSKKRVLREGDLVSLDFGVVWKGYYGDSAVTVPVGNIRPEHEKLMKITREATEKGIEKMKAGARLSDISHAVQTFVEAHGYGVVRDFVGHGIGTSLHEDPQLPNYGVPGRGPRLEPGMVLAIEPMVTEKSPEVYVESDGWTARTRDGGWAAHFEHSVAITENGPWILGLSPQ